MGGKVLCIGNLGVDLQLGGIEVWVISPPWVLCV